MRGVARGGCGGQLAGTRLAAASELPEGAQLLLNVRLAVDATRMRAKCGHSECMLREVEPAEDQRAAPEHVPSRDEDDVVLEAVPALMLRFQLDCALYTEQMVRRPLTRVGATSDTSESCERRAVSARSVARGVMEHLTYR